MHLVTHRRRAGEGDLGDPVRRGQRLADLLAVAVENVDHTGGHQVCDHLQHHQDGDRGLFRRLEHHTVARCQRGRQLPAGHQQWKIPRNDLAHHPKGLMEVITDRGCIDLRGTALLGTDATGEVAEVVYQQGDISVQGLADTLAVFPGFHIGQGFQVGLQAIGDAQQQVGALARGGLAPVFRRGMRRVQGLVQVCGCGAGHFTERLTGHRRDILEVVALKRRNPLAADEVFITVLEREQRVIAARHCIAHLLFLSRWTLRVPNYSPKFHL